MQSKEEIEILESYTNRCEKCGQKEEVGFCTNCYVEEDNMRIISGILRKYRILESREQKLIEKLEKENNKDMESVKYYEQARRDCKVNSEYKRIYQNYINELNAKRELRKEILEILKGENDE